MRSRQETGRRYESVDPRRLAVVLLTVGLLAGFAPGCGSDSNDGGMTTIPCLALADTTDPAADTVVAADGGSTVCNLLLVDLIVSDLTDDPELFAANFDVVYPANLVLLTRPDSLGSVLASDGAAVNVTAAELVSGRATIGMTRLTGTGPGVTVDGESLLIRLRFVLLTGSGSGDLTIENAQLLDSQGAPAGPQEIPGITWFGATIQILQN